MELIKRHCMTCGNPTTRNDGFCTFDCEDIFLDSYKTKPTKKELKSMIITKEIKSEQK